MKKEKGPQKETAEKTAVKKPRRIFRVLIAAAALALLGLIIWYFCSGLYGEEVTVRKEHLNSFSYSRAGDMIGSFYQEEIRLLDDGGALLTVTTMASHNAPAQKAEYRLDGKVLEELEQVFRRYHMNRWTHRNLSRVFVADGASHSYDFTLGETDFHFSSQLYPLSCRNKLQELHDIIDRYKGSAEG